MRSGIALRLNALALCAFTSLHAAILPEALLSFPANSEYLEYEDLSSLRSLPNYKILSDRFAGKPLEDTRAVLGQLRINETQVREVVIGSAGATYFGLLAGEFNNDPVKMRAARQRYKVKLLDSTAFCTGRSTCILFFDDSLAAFGSLTDLKILLQTRQGVVTRLSTNRQAVTLLDKCDRNTPVRGILLGAQLNTSISDLLKDWSGWKRDWRPVSANIQAIGYSVKLDAKSHVNANLECKSSAGAALLLQLLNAAATFQSVTASQNVAPFQNLQASVSGAVVNLKADAEL